MKLVIVGPGAIGLLLYSHLKPVNSQTYLLDKNQQRAQNIKRQGIRVTGISGERNLSNVLITSQPEELPQADLVLICVKSYQTASAVEQALPCIGKSTYVASFQNGLGNAEAIKQMVDERMILVGVTNQGATLISEGYIRHAGRGETVIGCYRKDEFQNVKGMLEEIVHLFKKANFDISIQEDIESVIWSKLIVNVGINALTAITNLKNGKLVEEPELKILMHSLVAEAVEVAQAKKVKLLFQDAYQKVEEVCRLTKENISSMLQDMLKGKRTEIDAINGAIVREANQLGLSVPHNEFVTRLVHVLEARAEERIFKL